MTFDPARRVQAILDSPTYRLAEDDTVFMESDAARASRLALEFMRADVHLRNQRIDSTVVVFGGSRIKSPEEARRALAALEASAQSGGSADHAAHLARARRDFAYCRYYEEARALSRCLAESCGGTDRHDLVVVTGGGPGIMEAANRGASEAGAPSIGFNIRLPAEQQPNPYITPGLAFRFHYFALRKMHFLLRARALVAFPGGYGTLDELFESLNLVQTNTIRPIPVVLVGADYWRRAVNFDYLVTEGFIAPADRELVSVVESGEQAASLIVAFHRRCAAGQAGRIGSREG